MSIASLENIIVMHLRYQLRIPKITRKWLREWSTSESVVKDGIQPGEQLVEIREPGLHVWCAIQDPKTLKGKS